MPEYTFFGIYPAWGSLNFLDLWFGIYPYFWKFFSCYYFKYFFAPFFLLFLVFPLCICCTCCICFTGLRYFIPFLLPFLFPFAFQFGKFLLTYFKLTNSFLDYVQPPVEPIKGILLLVRVYWFLEFAVNSFLKFPFPPYYFTLLFFHVAHFFH